jgi:hypothetical protein
LDVVSVDKPDMFEMMFGKEAEKRKEFMMQ